MMTSSVNAIVGESDQNLSSALDSLSDYRVRFTSNNDNEYLLVNDDNNKKMKKILRPRSNQTHEFNRQLSTVHRKIDQFQVK